MSLLEWLFKPQVHVLPTTSTTELFGWQVVSQTPAQAFVNDWRRYGMTVALYNFSVLLRRRSA